MSGLLQKIGVNGVFGLYIVAVWGLLLLVNYLSRKSDTLEGGDRMSRMMKWYESRGFGTFFHIFVLGGTLLLALIGWRIPAEIERIYGAGAKFGLIFPQVEMSTIGRAAQVLGAFGLGFSAMRLMRYIVPIFAFLLVAVLVLSAIAYVLGRDIQSFVG